MKKFLALGILAAVLFLVPSVQAQEWYGGECGRSGYQHSWHPDNRWRHHRARGWGHADGYRAWNHENWRSQPAGWGNRYYGNWQQPPVVWQPGGYCR